MNLKNAPIGLFDSGLGGLTLLKEVRRYLPCEDIIYFGDLAHVPYGDRTLEEIEIFAHDIMGYLIKRGVKAILIACNTSSSVLLGKPLRGLTVQNLIPSAIAGALEVTKNHRIGMIANPGTCASKSHENELMRISPGSEFFAMPCPRLVPLIESGKLNGSLMSDTLDEYIPPLLGKGIDTLIMGCTHYPLAINAIRKKLSGNVTIVDPAEEAVLELRQKLVRKKLIRQIGGVPKYEFVTSAYRDDFESTVGEYLGVRDFKYHTANLWQTGHTFQIPVEIQKST